MTQPIDARDNALHDAIASLPLARTAPLQYVLRLADNALVLGQRNAEWCGHGPALEEDIAMANISLDLIGQARLLYSHAGVLEGRLTGRERHEDDYAYFRNERDFRNWTLQELPHHGALAGTARADRDFAVTIMRNFLYSALMAELWPALEHSSDPQLAAIAAKSEKEVRYHLRHAADWVVRLGDGTDESHDRMQRALDHLFPYMNECFAADDVEREAAAQGVCVLTADLRDAWEATLDATLEDATLQRPAPSAFVSTGKHGLHSEHMSYLLAEMQSLARAHPGAQW